jgi:hypothetical protein
LPRAVRCGLCAGPLFHSCPYLEGVVDSHGSSIGSTHGGAALILDRLPFRPGISQSCCGSHERLALPLVAVLAAEEVDRVLARLDGSSLLTFSLDGSAVTAHRLVMRVIRENLAADGALTAVCESAARLLDGLAEARRENWHEDRTATRDLVEQITALDESAARCPPGGDLDRQILRLRWWAAALLGRLGDSAAQAIVIGERLLAAHERVLGPDHPDTLTARNNLAASCQVAAACPGGGHEKSLGAPVRSARGLTVKPGPAPVRSAYCKLAAAKTREARRWRPATLRATAFQRSWSTATAPRNVESRS